MKLIDLDEFTKLSQNNVADLSSLEEELDINYVWDMGYIECLKVLDSCSVIKAIPVEWIEKWLKAQERIVLISPPYYNQVTVPKMLEDWEKENADL